MHIVGYVGEVYGWHYGFSLAGIGMIIGQTIFLRGNRNFSSDLSATKNNLKISNFTKIEKGRVKLIGLASLILIIFWASFEQAGGLMNIFAYEKTNRYSDLINFEIPASWFQSINPLLIIL